MNLSVLEKLIHPVSIETFFKNYWHKKLLHIPRNDNNYFKEFIHKNAVDEWFQKGDVSYPNISLYKSGSGRIHKESWVNPKEPYQTNKPIDKDALVLLFQDGHSILVNHISNHIPKIKSLLSQLRAYFPDSNIQDYLVITGPSQLGFPVHADCEDVFMLHVDGSKKWYFYDAWPPYLQKEKVRNKLTLKPTAEMMVHAGDFIYIPPNLRHRTETTGETSTSLSIVIDLFRGTDFLNQIVSGAFVSSPHLREKVPSLNFMPEEQRQEYYERIKQLFIDHLETVNFDDVLSELMLKENKFAEPVYLYKTRERLLVTPDSHLTRNKDITFTLNPVDNVIFFKFLNKVTTYHRVLEMTLKFITEKESFYMKELPGFIKPEEKIELVQDLADRGLLEIGS